MARTGNGLPAIPTGARNRRNNYMDANQREQLRKQILERLEQMSGQMPSLKEAAQPVAPDSALGRLTRLDAIQGREMTMAAIRQAEAEMAALEGALERIDHPAFGLCAICEEPIPPKRLMAMPATRACVGCA